ncbi:MAG: hypothetical protein ISQ85_06920 [Planktomarina sp.]|nr:hypothetical protein [Planktomarina sp.]
MIKTKKFTLIIILLLISGYFWVTETTDVHTNEEADIELIKSEVSKHLGISLIDDDLFFVSRRNDFGNPFNHAAVDFIYLDAIINKPLMKEKLLIKFNETNLKTDGDDDVFLSLALSVVNICEYTQQTNTPNSTFCDNDSLEHRHSTISSDNEFGHFAVFYDAAQKQILLRRFWALDTNF